MDYEAVLKETDEWWDRWVDENLLRDLSVHHTWILHWGKGWRRCEVKGNLSVRQDPCLPGVVLKLMHLRSTSIFGQPLLKAAILRRSVERRDGRFVEDAY